MGNSLDRLGGYGSQESEGSSDTPGPSSPTRRKRKGESSGDSPVKVTKLDTAKYVYEKLYLQGEGSDIRVNALGHTWNLHKVYLRQCEFFQVLLDGEWEDSKNSQFDIEIPDENVTREGLHALFGCLYNDEIEYTLDSVSSVIAAASFFKHEGVLSRCDEELVYLITEETVARFNNMAKMYGLKTLRKECMDQLKWNFWRLMRNYNLLQELEKDDFLHLLSSVDLLVMEGEFDLYRMLKTWIYLKHTDSFTFVDMETLARNVREFLHEHEDDDLFLAYADLFAALRLHHLITSTTGMAEVEEDRLIPKQVLRALMCDQWKTMLNNEENPKISAGVADEDFYLNCFRGGRRVESSPRCWRWVGYNNGVDLVINYNRGIITLKRNCFHTATPYSVNLKSERVIHYRVIVCDSEGKCIQDTGKKELTMALDQSSVVCRLPESVGLPVSVHLFYLAAQPPPPSFLYVNQYLKSRMPQTV